MSVSFSPSLAQVSGFHTKNLINNKTDVVKNIDTKDDSDIKNDNVCPGCLTPERDFIMSPFDDDNSIICSGCGIVQDDNYQSKVAELKVCLGCKTPEDKFVTISEDGDIICPNCGIIQDERIIDDGPEWRNYSEDGVDKSRCGPGIDIYSTIPQSLHSYIPNSFGNIYAKWQIRMSRTSAEKSYRIICKSLEGVAENNGLIGPVLTTAEFFWEKIMQKKIVTRGLPRKGLAATCIYYACIRHGVSRSKTEIAQMFHLNDTKNITEGQKTFQDLFANDPEIRDLLCETIDSSELFIRMVNKLGLPFIFVRKMELLRDMCEDRLVGNTQKTIAAGLITFILKDIYKWKKPTKTLISKTVEVSSPSINKIENLIKSLNLDENRLIELENL